MHSSITQLDFCLNSGCHLNLLSEIQIITQLGRLFKEYLLRIIIFVCEIRLSVSKESFLASKWVSALLDI